MSPLARLYSFELVSLAWIVDRNKVCRKSGESAVEAIFVNLTTGLESKRQRLREPHKSGGYHYHVGVKTVNASKNSYARLVRATFPEFEGMQLDVQAKKGWGPVCAYVTKEDKSPLIWGEYNLEQVLELAEAFRARRKSKGLANNPSGLTSKSVHLSIPMPFVGFSLFKL
ncbi:UNVERIFIED_CONTAM: hypothetical protein Scaly_3093400 [Sesamum calycinum]|uniref:Uncharacterized protein n=1 Tax=Sesamum calycinum TaxID=2727403 RepID=A0AAW2JPT7_9LAMI